MPRDDDRYADDDYDDRPRRRTKGGGNTTLYVLLGVGLVGLLGCGGIILAIVIEGRKLVKDIKDGVEQVRKAEPEAGPPMMHVTAVALGREYADDEEAADAKFLNNTVRVDGVVEKIDHDQTFDGMVTVRLAPAGANPTAPRVEAEFHVTHSLAGLGLTIGESVSVVGMCEGREEIDPNDEEWPKNARPKFLIRLSRCRLAGPADGPPVPPPDAPPKTKAKPGREQAPAPKKAEDAP